MFVCLTFVLFVFLYRSCVPHAVLGISGLTRQSSLGSRIFLKENHCDGWNRSDYRKMAADWTILLRTIHESEKSVVGPVPHPHSPRKPAAADSEEPDINQEQMCLEDSIFEQKNQICMDGVKIH